MSVGIMQRNIPLKSSLAGVVVCTLLALLYSIYGSPVKPQKILSSGGRGSSTEGSGHSGNGGSGQAKSSPFSAGARHFPNTSEPPYQPSRSSSGHAERSGFYPEGYAFKGARGPHSGQTLNFSPSAASRSADPFYHIPYTFLPTHSANPGAPVLRSTRNKMDVPVAAPAAAIGVRGGPVAAPVPGAGRGVRGHGRAPLARGAYQSGFSHVGPARERIGVDSAVPRRAEADFPEVRGSMDDDDDVVVVRRGEEDGEVVLVGPLRARAAASPSAVEGEEIRGHAVDEEVVKPILVAEVGSPERDFKGHRRRLSLGDGDGASPHAPGSSAPVPVPVALPLLPPSLPAAAAAEVDNQNPLGSPAVLTVRPIEARVPPPAVAARDNQDDAVSLASEKSPVVIPTSPAVASEGEFEDVPLAGEEEEGNPNAAAVLDAAAAVSNNDVFPLAEWGQPQAAAAASTDVNEREDEPGEIDLAEIADQRTSLGVARILVRAVAPGRFHLVADAQSPEAVLRRLEDFLKSQSWVSGMFYRQTKHAVRILKRFLDCLYDQLPERTTSQAYEAEHPEEAYVLCQTAIRHVLDKRTSLFRRRASSETGEPLIESEQRTPKTKKATKVMQEFGGGCEREQQAQQYREMLIEEFRGGKRHPSDILEALAAYEIAHAMGQIEEISPEYTTAVEIGGRLLPVGRDNPKKRKASERVAQFIASRDQGQPHRPDEDEEDGDVLDTTIAVLAQRLVCTIAPSRAAATASCGTVAAKKEALQALRNKWMHRKETEEALAVVTSFEAEARQMIQAASSPASRRRPGASLPRVGVMPAARRSDEDLRR